MNQITEIGAIKINWMLFSVTVRAVRRRHCLALIGGDAPPVPRNRRWRPIIFFIRFPQKFRSILKIFWRPFLFIENCNKISTQQQWNWRRADNKSRRCKLLTARRGRCTALVTVAHRTAHACNVEWISASTDSVAFWTFEQSLRTIAIVATCRLFWESSIKDVRKEEGVWSNADVRKLVIFQLYQYVFRTLSMGDD